MLTLGYPGSGKTVLQSFIYYYIATDGTFLENLEEQSADAQPSYLTQSLLNKWVKDWTEGRFPESTRESVEAIREIRLKVTPKINRSKRFNFSFVEVSGELIKSVIPTEIQAGSIVQTMHKFLTSTKSKKIIVYVFDINEDSNNDELFTSLIRYLEGSTSGNLDKFYSLLIIVPNPDAVFSQILKNKRLQTKKFNTNQLTPEAMLHYVRLRAPQLVTTFRYWRKSKRGILKFHIGSVTENSLGEPELIDVDFTDSQRIINFCYNQFHGSKLKAGWYTRFKEALMK